MQSAADEWKSSTAQSVRMRPERGVALLEVLVAMIFVIIGLGGAVLMTIQSLRAAQESWFRAVADTAAADMRETIFATGAAGDYLVPWQEGIAAATDQGTGLVMPAGAGRFTVTVSWNSRFDEDGEPVIRSVLTTVRVP